MMELTNAKHAFSSFIPTEGINKKNYMDFISLKNVLCVGMSKFDE